MSDGCGAGFWVDAVGEATFTFRCSVGVEELVDDLGPALDDDAGAAQIERCTFTNQQLLGLREQRGAGRGVGGSDDRELIE